jgi:hypothetical protein
MPKKNFAQSRLCLTLALGVATGACTREPQRFPLAPPVWEDLDRNHVPGPVAERFSGTYADGFDKTVLRPVAETLAVRRRGESQNVNALDEVPGSAWFTNRIGLRSMSPAEVARGSCEGKSLQSKPGLWIITGAKPDGVTPGFFIKASDGRKYLLKLGGRRAAAADAIGARLYHAAGYFAPCNDVVVFAREQLRVGPGAKVKDALGRKRGFDEARLDALLSGVPRRADGRFLAVASRFIPGTTIGAFRYEGVRKDDPNDVIPHQDRRELRAARLLAAWIGRFDTRDQNSLDTLIEEQGRRYVRHYQLDFGDALGEISDDALSRRMNHSYFLDLEHVLVDLVTFGAVPRPWYRRHPARMAGALASFRWDDFDPLRWRPIYPNPAFKRMTLRDALWMSRIIARFSDQHLSALVEVTRLEDPAEASHLLRALIERRDRILRAYLERGSPVGRVAVLPAPQGGQRLCFEDLGIVTGTVPRGRVMYRVTLVSGRRLEKNLGNATFPPDAHHPGIACVPLPLGERRPAPAGTRWPPGDPRAHAVARIVVQQSPAPPRMRLDVHLYDGGPGTGFVLVGLDRVPDADGGSLYAE